MSLPEPNQQMVLVSRSTLDSLTEGIAASLSRMKDLEDQVKVIPSLQRTVDMMLQSSCSNGFCSTNSQRSTPSTTSFESSSIPINNLNHSQQRISNNLNNHTSTTRTSISDQKTSPMEPTTYSSDNLIHETNTETPIQTKIDFDDLINDLISLSYSVNYISSSASSNNSSNTLASSMNTTNTEPCKETLFHNSLSSYKSKPNRIYNHSLPNTSKYNDGNNHRYNYHHSTNNTNSLHKISIHKPTMSLHSVLEGEVEQPRTQANIKLNNDSDRDHDSCPPYFFNTTNTYNSNNINGNSSASFTQMSIKQDMAVNTDLFMEDIITRGELNSYIRKHQMHANTSPQPIADSVRSQKQLKQQLHFKQKGGHHATTYLMTPDCNMSIPTFIEPSISSINTTHSNYNKQHNSSSCDTGYDTFERYEDATRVDNKNIWGIMNYLNEDNESTTAQETHLEAVRRSSVANQNEHVTTILINQAPNDDKKLNMSRMHQKSASASSDNKDQRHIRGASLLSSSKNQVLKPIVGVQPKTIVQIDDDNDRKSTSSDTDSNQREKVKIKVELPKSFAAIRTGKTSIPISISSLSFSSTSTNTSNPTSKSSQSNNGQLCSELTTSSSDDEEKESDAENDSSTSDSNDAGISRLDSGKISSSYNDQTSVSTDDEDEEEDGDVDGDKVNDDASSLGSYQDPSDFEEYCAYGLTSPAIFNKILSKPVTSTSDNDMGVLRQPSKQFKEVLQYLADHLKEDDDLEKIQEATNHFEVIRKEWFGVATRKDSCYLLARVYLNLFESHSKQLLNTVVNLTDIAGNSVLHYAASHFNYNLLNVLLDTKVCDINRRNKAGYTPIMLLALADIGDHFKEMVARRVFQMGNVNIEATQNGQTALMLAASHGRIKTCKLLLECGADPSIQDKDGSTALMCGSEIGHLDIVKCLLAHRLTDPNTTDNDGLDALAIAMDNGHRDVGLVLYAAKNMLRTKGGPQGMGASLRRTSSKSSSLYPVRRSDSLASAKNRQQTRAKFYAK